MFDVPDFHRLTFSFRRQPSTTVEFDIFCGPIRVSRVQIQAEPQLIPGRFKPGINSRKLKQLKVAAKLAELVAEYFPNGGYSVMDANRLKLAAAHYIDADLCRDPVIRQRATRCAEYLLSKLKPPAPRPAPALETARAMLDRLGKGDPPAV